MADKNPWTWDPDSHRYRNTSTGRYIGQAQMLGLRDAFADAQSAGARALTSRLGGQGGPTLDEWEGAMRSRIKSVMIDQYVLGRGGRNAMTQADWGRVGAMCREQYRYLGGFAGDLAAGRYADADGNLDGSRAAHRAGMYMDAAIRSYEVGHARSYGLSLPGYPGDGNCAGLTNCRCYWDIRDAETEYRCTWVAVGDSGTCSSCDERAGKWAPLTILKILPADQAMEAARTAAASST